MWVFMYICYALSGITFLMLLTGLTQSYWGFPVLQANHLVFMILTSIMYCLTETLVIFFFVGTGVSIREYSQQHNLPQDYHRQSIAIKRRVYPPLMTNLLLMMTLFVLTGAVDTGKVAPWVYHILFIVGLLHFLYVKAIQNQCFAQNTRVVLAMAGVQR